MSTLARLTIEAGNPVVGGNESMRPEDHSPRTSGSTHGVTRSAGGDLVRGG